MSDKETPQVLNELEKSKDLMLERGKIKLNSHEFIIKPVFLGEETQYLADVKISPIPIKANNEEITTETKFTEKELNSHIMALFTKKQTSKKTIKNLFKKLNKASFYSDTHAEGLVKWLEKKVYYNNKRVKFCDLERKFELSKVEIEQIIIELHRLSGF